MVSGGALKNLFPSYNSLVLFLIILSLGIGIPVYIFPSIGYKVSLTDLVLLVAFPAVVRSPSKDFKSFLKPLLPGFTLLIGLGISVFYHSTIENPLSIANWLKVVYMYIAMYTLLKMQKQNLALIYDSFNVLLWGTILFGIIGLVLVIFEVKTPLVWENQYYFGWSNFRLSALDGHPNGAAQVIFFSWVILVFNRYYKSHMAWIHVVIFGSLLLTGSKSILIYGSILLLYRYYYTKKIRILIPVAIVFISVNLFFSHYIPVTDKNRPYIIHMYAFGEPVAKAGGYDVYSTSYTVNKKAALEIFKQSPVLGIGSSNYIPKIREMKERDMYPSSCNYMQPHSTYTGVLARFGMIGFLGLLGMIILVYREVIRLKTDGIKTTFTIIFLCFLLEACTADFEYHHSLWFFMAWLATYFERASLAYDDK